MNLSFLGRLCGLFILASSVHADAVEQSVGTFEFEGSLELVHEEIRKVSLGQRIGDNERTSKQELQLQLSYRANDRLSAFAEIKGQFEQRVDAVEASRTSENELERGELWVFWQPLPNKDVSIKIGRQNFADPRQWWWDEDLDALRLDYTGRSLHLTLGIAEAVVRKSSLEYFIEPPDDEVLRLLGHANWKYSSGLEFSLFYLAQRDESSRPLVNSRVKTEKIDESDADLRWLGLRSSGQFELKWGSTLTYWMDAAAVTGEEVLFEYSNDANGNSRIISRQTQRVHGRALDMGAIWKPIKGTWPSLAVSYARGSGDKNPNDTTDHAFRQTGLQDPTQEFRYYGELLRPELSNLSVSTAAIAFPILAESRLTLGYHRFQQIYPADFLRDGRIDLSPTGQDTDIGREISLLVEIQEWENVQVVFSAATFRAGNAYGAATGKHATSIFLEVTYDF